MKPPAAFGISYDDEIQESPRHMRSNARERTPSPHPFMSTRSTKSPRQSRSKDKKRSANIKTSQSQPNCESNSADNNYGRRTPSLPEISQQRSVAHEDEERRSHSLQPRGKSSQASSLLPVAQRPVAFEISLDDDDLPHQPHPPAHSREASGSLYRRRTPSLPSITEDRGEESFQAERPTEKKRSKSVHDKVDSQQLRKPVGFENPCFDNEKQHTYYQPQPPQERRDAVHSYRRRAPSLPVIKESRPDVQENAESEISPRKRAKSTSDTAPKARIDTGLGKKSATAEKKKPTPSRIPKPVTTMKRAQSEEKPITSNKKITSDIAKNNKMRSQSMSVKPRGLTEFTSDNGTFKYKKNPVSVGRVSTFRQPKSDTKPQRRTNDAAKASDETTATPDVSSRRAKQDTSPMKRTASSSIPRRRVGEAAKSTNEVKPRPSTSMPRKRTPADAVRRRLPASTERRSTERIESPAPAQVKPTPPTADHRASSKPRAAAPRDVQATPEEDVLPTHSVKSTGRAEDRTSHEQMEEEQTEETYAFDVGTQTSPVPTVKSPPSWSVLISMYNRELELLREKYDHSSHISRPVERKMIIKSKLPVLGERRTQSLSGGNKNIPEKSAVEDSKQRTQSEGRVNGAKADKKEKTMDKDGRKFELKKELSADDTDQARSVSVESPQNAPTKQQKPKGSRIPGPSQIRGRTNVRKDAPKDDNSTMQKKGAEKNDKKENKAPGWNTSTRTLTLNEEKNATRREATRSYVKQVKDNSPERVNSKSKGRLESPRRSRDQVNSRNAKVDSPRTGRDRSNSSKKSTVESSRNVKSRLSTSRGSSAASQMRSRDRSNSSRKTPVDSLVTVRDDVNKKKKQGNADTSKGNKKDHVAPPRKDKKEPVPSTSTADDTDDSALEVFDSEKEAKKSIMIRDETTPTVVKNFIRTFTYRKVSFKGVEHTVACIKPQIHNRNRSKTSEILELDDCDESVSDRGDSPLPEELLRALSRNSSPGGHDALGSWSFIERIVTSAEERDIEMIFGDKFRLEGMYRKF